MTLLVVFMALCLGAIFASESKRARQSERRFRATFDQAAVGIGHVAPDGSFIRVNKKLCGIVGLTEKELLGKRFEEITHPEDLEADWAQATALLRGEIETYSMAKRYLHKTGSIIWIQLTVSLVHTSKGAPDYFISVIEDITERKETAEKLRQAEDRFHWLVNASPVGVVETDRDGRVIKANPAFYTIVGWGQDAFRRSGMDLRKLTPDDWIETNLAQVKVCFENGTPTVYEKEYLRGDHTRVPVMIALSFNPATANANANATPGTGQALAFVVDLSEQKRVEAQLRRSEERLKFAQRAAHAGVYDWNVRTGELEWSEETFALYGVARETPVTRDLWLSLVAREDRDRVAASVASAINTANTFNAEFRILKNGELAWISSTGQCQFDSSGQAVRFAGIAIDITARKLAEAALVDNERVFRQLADAMPQIVWTARPDGYLDYYNQKWYDLTGSSRDTGGDESWAPILHPDDLQPCLDIWYAAVASGHTYEIQYRFWDRRRNSFRWHLGRALPLHNERGQIVKWVGTCTDIHDHKQLSEQLEVEVEARTAQLQESLDEKTTLLKEVHHRVKNNLQVISSLLSMQIDYSPEAAFSHSLSKALHRVQSMALIHEQLYLSKTLSSLDFGAYIGILSRNLFQAYCLDPDRIAFELSTEPIALPIDQAIPCGLILNELVSNSLKHAFPKGRGGRIGISFRGAPGGCVELTVEDNGCGLPPSFNMATANSLGLQVVRALVSQLRADHRIESADGTKMTLTWPVGAPDERLKN